MKYCSHPTSPRTRSTKREDRPWADCRVVRSVRKTPCGRKKNHEVIRESGYLRSRQGLGPWRPILVVITGVGGAVRGKSITLLGPFGPPCWGSLPFLPSPPLGERPFSSPPRLCGRSLPRSHRPITPENGNSFECPWPSSWPSSPAPRGVPEPAAPLSGRPLGLLEKGPDS